MDVSWLIIIPVVVAVALIAAILFIQNQKDEKVVEQNFIEEDELSVKDDSENENETII